jgi:acetyltransferase-like isoleucine patch superfamily enzyme
MKVLRILGSEIQLFWHAFITSLPEGFLGQVARKYYWRSVLGDKVGTPFSIQRGASVDNHDHLHIGCNFILSENAYVAPGDSLGIWIGDYVSIARNSYIRSANHRFDDVEVPIVLQGHEFKTIPYAGKEYSIVIEDDVWIAANAVILSGAHIGKGSVVGAGSVVGSVIPPYSIVLGNPGRRVRSRLPSGQGGLDEKI